MTVDLSNNENVLGPSPLALRAATAALGDIHRYPPRQDEALRAALARLHGVVEDQVLLGNGAQHVIRVIAATFLGSGDVAAGLDPTYTGYRAATETIRATYEDVPAAGGGYDPAVWSQVARRARLLWLCSPVNPTGCAMPHDTAEAILDALASDAVAVLDATYSDFLEDDRAVDAFALLERDPRVVVVKTFSKLHGLAGLRLGYAIARPQVINALAARIDTFPANRVALAAGLAALDDVAHQDATRRLVLEGRSQLQAGLSRLGLEAYPSQANFVTVRVGQDRRDACVAALRQAGVLVRPLDGVWRLPDCVRIGVGRAEHVKIVLDTLERWLP